MQSFCKTGKGNMIYSNCVSSFAEGADSSVRDCSTVSASLLFPCVGDQMQVLSFSWFDCHTLCFQQGHWIVTRSRQCGYFLSSTQPPSSQAPEVNGRDSQADYKICYQFKSLQEVNQLWKRKRREWAEWVSSLIDVSHSQSKYFWSNMSSRKLGKLTGEMEATLSSRSEGLHCITPENTERIDTTGSEAGTNHRNEHAPDGNNESEGLHCTTPENTERIDTADRS
ncbi:uncharacterized protein LOC121291784 isoform X3 [Carcharodon carcharias]|uniref:uncharacterized protein LOC121291784 isoform X3 n=1 Tax=Carcharodon carcharias TaxID=13397 RepID=UPI001B7F331D|nr:uncharacterized protein LOC121291784 isoform X3 [Carcharodon carcharias]